MPESLDLRTKDNHWIVTHQTDSRTYEIPNAPYDAWIKQRTVTADGRTWPEQTSFFAGWDALQDWLMYGLGFEGRLSEYARPSTARKTPNDDQIVETLDLALESLWKHYTVLEQAGRLHPAIHDILSNVKKPDAIAILERLRHTMTSED